MANHDTYPAMAQRKEQRSRGYKERSQQHAETIEPHHQAEATIKFTIVAER